MPYKLYRRTFTKLSVLSGAGLLVLPACDDAAVPSGSVTLTPDERELLERFAEVYLPTDGTSLKPRAEVPVVDNIEHALSLNPNKWALDDFVAVGVNVKRLYLADYIVDRWRAPAARRRAIAAAILRFYATLRRHGFFRKLGLKREDVEMWRYVAGRPVTESPLERPEIDAALHRLL